MSTSVSFDEWKRLVVPVAGQGAMNVTTMEEAMLDFFYSGVEPWIQGSGYYWSITSDSVAKRFVYFCYVMSSTLDTGDDYTIEPPYPRHRDLPEDLDTFNIFADMASFSDMLLEWRDRSEIVGTQLDHMIRDLCYVWIDVERGQPARWAEATIEMNDECNSDEEGVSGGPIVPDGNWSKTKNDLY